MNSDIIDFSFLDKIEPISLLPDNGVIKYILQQGESLNPGQKPPQKGTKAYIKLESRKIDGSSVEERKNMNQERKINLFTDKYIEGIHISVASMKKKEIAWFKIEPKYHFFGASGGGDLSLNEDSNINKNDPLLYKIELVDFKNVNLSSMDFEGRIQAFEESREKGKELFSKNKYNEAYDIYMKSIFMLRNFPNNLKDSLNEDQKAQIKHFSNLFFSNAALCKIKTKTWYEALKLTEEGLIIASSDVKLLYRQAQCHMGLHEFSKAIEYFKKVIELEPENTDAKQQVKLCGELKNQEKIIEKIKCEQIFQKMAEEEKKEKLEKKKKDFLLDNLTKEAKIKDGDHESKKKKISMNDLEKGIIIDANGPNGLFSSEKTFEEVEK